MIIYNAKTSPKKGIVWPGVSILRRFAYRAISYTGITATSLSLSLLIYSYIPTFNSELDINVDQQIVVENIINSEDVNDEQLVISIPQINAVSNIVKNVDPFSVPEYKEALKFGVAHAKGTGFPGEGRRIYLFAHSTNSPLFVQQYNAVFYDLRKLTSGDTITIESKSKKYEYIVIDKKIVAASDISWLMGDQEEDLILQTCDPPGTSWRRLLVVAKPI